jgi:integrase
VAYEHLRQRGRQWYLQLGIPKSLRPHFGKAVIEQPLGDSYERARIECSRRIGDYMELFARLRAGEPMSSEQIKAVLRGHRDEEDLGAAFWLWRKQNPVEDARQHVEMIARRFERYAASRPWEPAEPAAPVGETISQAAAAWFPEVERTKPRASTLKGLRDHVRAFIDKCGDIPLTAVDRAKASDFLDQLNVSTGTRNAYARTLKRVFKCAARRGRFSKLGEDNPFDGQHLKVTKGERVPRDRFTIEELQKLFDAFPRDTAPAKHSPESAVPWAALIAAFSGVCLEEVCQLTVDDIREEKVNGGMLVCINIHNGDSEHLLKNESARPRLLPIHSELERAGLLDYIANVRKQGHEQLFPGLKRRASKDGKIGPRVGELFNKKRRALGIARKGKKLDFHSFRHTVSNTLEIAGATQTDAARVLGHTIEGMSYGNYSEGGPGLIRVKSVIEQIVYEGLRP